VVDGKNKEMINYDRGPLRSISYDMNHKGLFMLTDFYPRAGRKILAISIVYTRTIISALLF